MGWLSKHETGYGAHRHNLDEEFDERAARGRIYDLERLIETADELGYEFHHDDYANRIPQDEIEELNSKLFIGPRRSMQYDWNDPNWNHVVDQVFTGNSLFRIMRGE